MAELLSHGDRDESAARPDPMKWSTADLERERERSEAISEPEGYGRRSAPAGSFRECAQQRAHVRHEPVLQDAAVTFPERCGVRVRGSL